MTIQNNIDNYQNTKKEVMSHCMCYDFEETNRHFYIYYPSGFSVGGVRVEKGQNKANSLKLALVKMEKEWQDSYPSAGVK